MGVEIREENKKIIINGKGLESLQQPNKDLYLGNSGTSARLLTGLLAAQKFNSVLTGDKSLSSRPMKRITNPLTEMGAKIKTKDGKLPLQISGSILKILKYKLIFFCPNKIRFDSGGFKYKWYKLY